VLRPIEYSKRKLHKCIKCGSEGYVSAFAKGTKLCKKCHNKSKTYAEQVEAIRDNAGNCWWIARQNINALNYHGGYSASRHRLVGRHSSEISRKQLYYCPVTRKIWDTFNGKRVIYYDMFISPKYLVHKEIK
jgi:ribosomal protein L20